MEATKPMQDTTLTIGNWLVSVTSPVGKKSEVPSVEIENLLTGQIVSYKLDKKSSGTLAYVNPNLPVSLSDGVVLTVENCTELLEVKHAEYVKKVAASKEATKEELDETEEVKDMKKCLLVLANNLSKLLANKSIRRQMLEILSKDVLIEITKSDWLVLKNEYDLYRFVKAWGNLRARRALGIKDPEPILGDDKGKGKEKEDDKGKDKEQEDDKGKEKEDKDKDDGSDSEGDEKKDGDTGKEGAKKKKKKKPLPEWKLTPEYRKLMNENLQGLLEHVRYPMMTHMALSHLEDEPFDMPLNLLMEAYRFHLYGEEKFYKKGRYARGAQCRSRRYLAIKWDPKKKSSQIDLSKDHLTITSTQSCSQKTVLGVHGFSSGKNSWEIKLNGQAGCYSAVGVARKNFKVEGGILGIEPDSWAFRLYPGSHCQTGDRRKEDSGGGVLNAGDVVRVDLDMDRGRVAISVNGNQKATWKGLTGTLYPALTICHQSGNEGYTLVRA